ncbi:hypothetical protein C8J55DRAFT_488081 [Lentinula edodes]|uniref:Uncharacterized protein n=1 Tax=Lentinula lateritia TaxID=40482 RepID=A0A9W9AKI9_9AGAR|nr:hypothetical protein C8J55DRAFT_488081 [Lentinula edodes]
MERNTTELLSEFQPLIITDYSGGIIIYIHNVLVFLGRGIGPIDNAKNQRFWIGNIIEQSRLAPAPVHVHDQRSIYLREIIEELVQPSPRPGFESVSLSVPSNYPRSLSTGVQVVKWIKATTAKMQREGCEDSIEIHKFEEPSCWRMTQSDAKGIFEVIRHMQGVLEDKKLPPIRGELMVAFGRGTELKARLLLRNITLLDATHTKFEDEEEDARKQMKGMNIENDENDNEREGTCE